MATSVDLMNVRRAIAALAATMMFAASIQTSAAHGSRSTTVRLSTSVIPNCSVSTSPVSFSTTNGYVQAPGKVVLVQSTLGLHCTKGTNASIGMDAGLYSGKTAAQFGSRSMKANGSANYIGYDLCHDSGCAQVWAANGYSYVSPTDQGSTLPVWGRIVTGQRVAFLGTYNDSVTVSVDF